MNFKHEMWVICLYKSKNNFKVHVVWLVLHKFGLKHLDSRDFSRSFRVDLKLPLIFLFTLFFIINTFSSVTIYFIYKMFLLVISKNWLGPCNYLDNTNHPFLWSPDIKGWPRCTVPYTMYGTGFFVYGTVQYKVCVYGIFQVLRKKSENYHLCKMGKNVFFLFFFYIYWKLEKS